MTQTSWPASPDDAFVDAVTYLPDNRRMLRRLEGAMGMLATTAATDFLTQRFLVRDWFPGSRLWALASETDSPQALMDRVQRAMPQRAKYRDRIADLHARTVAAEKTAAEAERRWQQGFFGGTLGEIDLRQLEIERRHSAAHHQTLRRSWIGSAHRLKVPAVDAVASTPEEVAAAGPGLIARQRDVDAAGGGVVATPSLQRLDSDGRPALEEFWLRLPSAQVDGGPHAYAHVYAPLDRPIVGTVIHLHGFCLEWDQLAVPARDVLGLTDLGCRVIVLEAPWHGRRRRPGEWGGAPMVTNPPLSMLQLLTAQLQEVARLTAYARRRWQQPVGWHGISMGALTAQLALSRANDWPQACRPDAAMLIVATVGMSRIAIDGAFGKGLGIDRIVQAAGWSEDRLPILAPIADPVEPPACGADRVVLVTGARDTVTPPPGAEVLRQRWKLPRDNDFRLGTGHITTPLHLYRDRTPTRRFIAKLTESTATPQGLSP